ncbi:GTPase HflX [compost metagenome]
MALEKGLYPEVLRKLQPPWDGNPGFETKTEFWQELCYILAMNETKSLKAVLVGIQTPKISDEEMKSSLQELARLVTTLGYTVIGQMSQRRTSQRGATVLGDGKLKELADWTDGSGVVGPMVVHKKHKAALKFSKNEDDDEDDDYEEILEEAHDIDSVPDETPREIAEVVIFDCDLSPSQLRNLESATGAPVLDRTGVIIEIFSRHARTRAARLQVEIARLTYVAPRLRETSAGDDRQGGGGKGAGETSIELDRRKIRDRVKELKQELGSIAQEHSTRRARREQEISVALVGYTNAGKSSLMRALTGSEVLVADKLFATLDTTVRVLHPETRPRILISDTVGFIKKLPHDLVASFKSTLDEALNASLLLYVVDSSDSTFRSQLEVTKSVLGEVGASEIDSILVLNKVDRLSEDELSALKAEYPEALFLSAVKEQDVADLRLHLVRHFETAMVDQDIFIPYDVQGAIGEIRAKMKVLSEEYDGRGVILKVRAHADAINRLKTRFGL